MSLCARARSSLPSDLEALAQYGLTVASDDGSGLGMAALLAVVCVIRAESSCDRRWHLMHSMAATQRDHRGPGNDRLLPYRPGC